MKENVDIKTKEKERQFQLSSANRWNQKAKQQNENKNKERKPWRKNSPKPQPKVFYQQNLLKNAQNQGTFTSLYGSNGSFVNSLAEVTKVGSGYRVTEV